MTTKNNISISLQMKQRIKELPQFSLIDSDYIDSWILSVLDKEPDRAMWHVNRLFGLGGSEIGVLLGFERGEYHPWETPRSIVRKKLLMEGLGELNGDLERGITMEPIAREKYLKQIENRGAKSILDEKLVKIISDYKNEKYPWLVGNPDDIIMEKNGDVYIVDYKVPNEKSFSHLLSAGVPYYYEAQLHHYKLILDDLRKQKKVNFKVKGLILAPLNLSSFKIIEMDVKVKKSLSNEIIRVGNKYWNEYVLKNELPPHYLLNDSVRLEDLQIVLSKEDENGNLVQVNSLELENKLSSVLTQEEKMLKITNENIKARISKLLGDNFVVAQLAEASKEVRDDLNSSLSELLPPSILNNCQIDSIEYLGIKIKINRNYEEEGLINVLKKICDDQNLDWKNVADIIEDPKNKTSPKYDMDTLIDLLKVHYNIDLLSEKEQNKIESAIIKKPEHRIDLLLSLIKQLDVENKFQYELQQTISGTTVSTVMPVDRTALLSKNKKEIREKFKIESISQILENDKPKIINDRTQLLKTIEEQKAQAEAEKKNKKKNKIK